MKIKWNELIVILGSIGAIIVSIISGNWPTLVWSVNTLLLMLYVCYSYYYQDKRNEIQDEIISDLGNIISIQADIIKELNDKLDEQTKSNENGVRDTELDQSGERSEKNMG